MKEREKEELVEMLNKLSSAAVMMIARDADTLIRYEEVKRQEEQQETARDQELELIHK